MKTLLKIIDKLDSHYYLGNNGDRFEAFNVVRIDGRGYSHRDVASQISDHGPIVSKKKNITKGHWQDIGSMFCVSMFFRNSDLAWRVKEGSRQLAYNSPNQVNQEVNIHHNFMLVLLVLAI